MTDGSPRVRSHIDVTTWSDAGSRDALDLVASSVAEMVGFEIAIISVVRGDHMYAVSVEGSNGATDAMLGLATPISMVHTELARADDWGRFQFVPHDRVELDVQAVGWVPDLEPIDAPDAWHPLDLLIAPLHDEAGVMIGLLSIDVPMTGRRPDPTQRHLLERYVLQAERALRMAVERDDLAERIRLAEAARRVVRFATSQDDLESVIDDCRHPLIEGFRADFLAIRIYPSRSVPAAGSPPTDLPDDVIELIRAGTRRAWTEQQVVVTGPFVERAGVFTDAEWTASEHALEILGLGSSMIVPLGAGRESLGHVILGRKDPGLRWSPDEQASALDIARDIGQAVVNSRNLAKEQNLVGELRRLATYKSEVLSTVSHELKNPLSAITGHLELLDSDPTITGDARRSIEALDRAARRMGRVVDDLLLLAEVEDPEGGRASEPMDAVPVLRDALELTRVAATRRRLTFEITTPEDEVLVCCDAVDLDRVVTNLVSNAVKYTPRGGRIWLTLVTHEREIELTVADEGIGISAADQARLFTEFFRSTNPQAVAQPGTGLGLTICRRIVERHGGRITVESELGVGSAFRVFLPRPA
ncbi:sensor histidine kinase [Nocardioides plantarum]|uniref:histidine kinase n=1 Tax=Nocardioides plantarum TaxID=29299 RepID=A0ABV5K4K4_9ACTN|nr:HAMP domain-containing sensor histidine kinase [Nocardioides plantarum]